MLEVPERVLGGRSGRCTFGTCRGPRFSPFCGSWPRPNRTGPRSALTYKDQTLTRAEFTDRVERLAALFASRGVTEGSTVTIGLPNSTASRT